MMTKRMWALAAVLTSAACTSSSEEGTLNAPQGSNEEAGKSGAMDASVPTGTAANGGSSASTGKPANVSTGNASATAGAGATKAGASGAVAPSKTGSAGAAGSADKAGSAGRAASTGGAGAAAADDSDAGTDDISTGAAGSGETGAAGQSAAGAGGAGGSAAGGAGAEKPPTRSIEVPKDPGEKGPWPVGVRTLDLDLGNGLKTPVEVWYPAKPGSESEKPKVSYDLTAWLPPEHGIPAEAPKVHIDCDCYRELTPDLEHGPYPVVVIVHGQASFRAAAASQMTHWASRGYIAIAADHPGLLMRDRLAGNAGCTPSGIPQDVTHTRDVPAIFRAIAQPEGIFSFLKGALDAERIALGGHGDGASYAADNTDQPGVKAVLSFSHAGIVPPAELNGGVFFLTGQSDKIEPYNTVLAAYDATSRGIRPTVLAGMSNVGHLGFTDLCGARNSDGQDAIAMARRYDICGGAAINVADQYFWDCPLSPLAGPDNYLDQAATTALVRKLSTYALEELLLGQSHAQEWAELAADKTWGELRQTR